MRGFEFLKLKIQINFLGVRLPRFLLLYWSVLLGSQRYVQQKQKKYCALTVTLFLCFSFSSAQVDFCPETCSGELYCLYFMVPCQLTSYRFCLKIFYLDCKKANLSVRKRIFIHLALCTKKLNNFTCFRSLPPHLVMGERRAGVMMMSW